MTLKSITDQCPKCGGEGYIWGTNNGYECVTECECMMQKRVDRYLKNSGIDLDEYRKKSLDTFKADAPEAKAMKDLAEKFLNDEGALGIGFFGKSGTGKTHICTAICQELTKCRKIPHLYFSYRTEVQKLKAVYFDQESFSTLMNKWTQCPVLYVDDLFKLAFDQQGRPVMQELQIMFDIINTRYINRKMTIFSSEFTVSEIREFDAATAGRIYEMTTYGMKCEGANRRFPRREIAAASCG